MSEKPSTTTLRWSEVRKDPSEYKREVYEKGNAVRVVDDANREVFSALAYGGKTGRDWNAE